MNGRYGIVDLQNGTMIDQLFDGDRIIRKNSAEAYKKVHGNQYIDENSVYWELDGYVKVNTQELSLWLPQLNVAERQLLLAMIPFVQYTSCAIFYRNHRPIDYDGLIEISGLGKSSVYSAVLGLRKKNIISVVKNSRTQFYICPWIVTKGMAINKTLKTMFCNYRIQSLGGKCWGELKEFQR